MDVEKYEKTIYELKQLLEVTKVLNSTLNFKKLVDSILFTFMAQARCVKAALYIGKEIEPEVITLQRNYMGFEITPHVPIQLNCKAKIMEFLAKNRRCLVTNEITPLISSDKYDFSVYIQENVELLIPLVINQKVAGLVLLGGRIDTDPISKSDKDFLSEIGIYASIAIQNALLFDMATMDMMTGLKIKHFITKFMDECIESGDHNFVVLMMDIDNFKNVNDTYGHQTGDDTIIGVSEVIKQVIRANDIASRFGGEEFVIMLRATTVEEAVVVAERIRKGIENLTIRHANGIMNVTISIGIAEFDDDIDKTPEDIIGRADNALYISKHNGKNRVTTA